MARTSSGSPKRKKRSMIKVLCFSGSMVDRSTSPKNVLIGKNALSVLDLTCLPLLLQAYPTAVSFFATNLQCLLRATHQLYLAHHVVAGIPPWIAASINGVDKYDSRFFKIEFQPFVFCYSQQPADAVSFFLDPISFPGGELSGTFQSIVRYGNMRCDKNYPLITSSGRCANPHRTVVTIRSHCYSCREFSLL